MGNRLRRYSDALCVLLCEAVAFGFFLRASTLLGTVEFSHFGAWLQSTSPQVALTALFRLLGLAISGWLLGSTLLYAAAALSGKRAVIAKTRFITLPVLRRVVDSLAVASVAASSIGSAAAASSAAPPPGNATIVWPVGPGAHGGGHMDSQAMARAPVAPARVSKTAIGRHFPHPGRVHHEWLPASPAQEQVKEVPSQQNGFAGLPPGTKVVVVKPGDCLSVLAEEHLGDWRLDSEIEALNYGRLQPDGRALVDDHWIYVGWVLVMPPDAVGAIVVGGGTPSHDAGPPGRKVVVARDTGHRPRRPASAPAEPRPPSRPSPPAKTTTTTTTTTTTATHGPTGQGVGASRAVASPAPAVPTTPALEPAPFSAPATTTTAAGERVEPLVAATTRDLATPDGRAPGHLQHGDGAELVLAAGLGAIAGGSIVWGLNRSRRRFGHSRPKGVPVPRNKPEVAAAERRARAIADLEKTRWVDQALRYLSGLVEERSLEGDLPVPSLALLRVGRRGLEVFVSPAMAGSLGWFSPTADGAALVLDAEVTLEELEALAADRWPAWPALVSLGDSEEGELLLNLEHAGSVSVEGPDRLVEGVLGRMLLELSSQPWSDEMLAGLYALGGPSFGQVQGLQNVPGDGAFDLAEKLDLVSGAQQELAGQLPISALRAVACEALPNVVVAFAGTPAGALQCFAEAAVPERSGVVLAAAGPYEGAAWKVLLSSDGVGTLQGALAGQEMSFEFRTTCDQEEVVLLGQALGAASDNGGRTGKAKTVGPVGDGGPPEEARGAHSNGNVTNGNGSNGAHRSNGGQGHGPDLPAPPRGDVEICVLGPVDIAGGDMNALEPSRQMAALALLAYMSTHERPVTADEIASALWPLDATKDNLNGPQRKTVMNAISRARAVLGYSATGKERIAYTPHGYRLSADVTSDWRRFEQYLANARRQLPTDAMTSLRKALELVRGEPFGGALSSQFFEWVASEHLDMTFSARAVDAAEDLGEMALEAGDLATVVWAVEKGLQLEPTREEMFRLWMHALGREGRPAKVDDVYRRLKVILRQRVHSLQEPQPQTRDVWRLYTAVELSGRQGGQS